MMLKYALLVRQDGLIMDWIGKRRRRKYLFGYNAGEDAYLLADEYKTFIHLLYIGYQARTSKKVEIRQVGSLGDSIKHAD